jgi:class 3 adenylate cyclase/tetratricopeptide (TPR) repeat protein
MTSFMLSVKRHCGIAQVQSYTRFVPARDEVRKTVTILFADVVSSTALGDRLDPEALRRVMASYFDEARAAIERHGGTVEKFIGDAVMAVFGIPTVHEDDALRAVRAADELRASLEPLNAELERHSGVTLEIRIGLNTGEVVAGQGETLVTGDAVNVAKRLEEAAGPGEILIGGPTQRLVRNAVEAEDVEPLALKGKSGPVEAFRLVSVREGIPERERRLDSPMVGRERERALLRQAYDRTVEDRACQLFTVLGAAGVGKSRLVAEFLDDLGDEATVVRGRCLPYGEGIAFWPLLEIVRRLYGDEPVPAIAGELEGERDAQLIAERVGAAVGLAEGAGGAEETAWSVRRLFEALAQARPLVVVFDDIQWGEPAFLQLVEHIADLSRDAPILVVCMARPELLDANPGWGGGKFNATSVLLEPLDERESTELLENLLGQQELAAIRARIAEAAEGNPLFVEEMLAMLIDDGVLERLNGGWTTSGDFDSIAVPPSIQALLSARLERLAEPERAVVGCASIEGKVFHRGAVASLFGEEVASHLHALVRKELVRPEAAEVPGEDAFRFRHLLIRDAAYESLPKERRAELHAQFAAWLQGAVGERAPEYDEVLGYHLERAYRFRHELGPPDDEARSLGLRAGEHLGSAGERAFARGDAAAVVGILGRAVELLPPEHPRRTQLLCDLGLALIDRGEFSSAETVLEEAAAAADARDDVAASITAALRLEWTHLMGSAGIRESEIRVNELAQSLEALRYKPGLAEASLMQGIIRSWLGRGAEAMERFERASALARTVGNHRVRSRSLSWMLLGCFWGPTPVSEGLRLCDRVIADSEGNRYVQGYAYVIRAALEAMAGRWDEGEERSTVGHAMLDDLGHQVSSAATRMTEAEAHFFAGRRDYAERQLRQAHEVLSAVGEKGYLSTVTALLALVVCARGAFDEAERYAAEAQQLGAADDLATETLRLSAQAEVLASRGDFAPAHAAIEEALDMLEGTDLLGHRASLFISQAAVFRTEGKAPEVRSALESSIRLWEQKGASSAVAWLNRQLAEL